MVARIRELVACCRGCLAWETLDFSGNRLLPAMRFKQGSDGRIYHDCGTGKACRLFPMFMGKQVLGRRRSL